MKTTAPFRWLRITLPLQHLPRSPKRPVRVAVRVLHHGAFVAVRVVETLDGRLAPRAEPSRIDRLAGVSFHLDDMTVPVLHEYAASRRTFPARACVPGRLAGHDIFGRDHVRDEMAHRVRAARERGCSGQPQRLEELTP